MDSPSSILWRILSSAFSACPALVVVIMFAVHWNLDNRNPFSGGYERTGRAVYPYFPFASLPIPSPFCCRKASYQKNWIVMGRMDRPTYRPTWWVSKWRPWQIGYFVLGPQSAFPKRTKTQGWPFVRPPVLIAWRGIVLLLVVGVGVYPSVLTT